MAPLVRMKDSSDPSPQNSVPIAPAPSLSPPPPFLPSPSPLSPSESVSSPPSPSLTRCHSNQSHRKSLASCLSHRGPLSDTTFLLDPWDSPVSLAGASLSPHSNHTDPPMFSTNAKASLTVPPDTNTRTAVSRDANSPITASLLAHSPGSSLASTPLPPSSTPFPMDHSFPSSPSSNRDTLHWLPPSLLQRPSSSLHPQSSPSRHSQSSPSLHPHLSPSLLPALLSLFTRWPALPEWSHPLAQTMPSSQSDQPLTSTSSSPLPSPLHALLSLLPLRMGLSQCQDEPSPECYRPSSEPYRRSHGKDGASLDHCQPSHGNDSSLTQMAKQACMHTASCMCAAHSCSTATGDGVLFRVGAGCTHSGPMLNLHQPGCGHATLGISSCNHGAGGILVPRSSCNHGWSGLSLHPSCNHTAFGCSHQQSPEGVRTLSAEERLRVDSPSRLEARFRVEAPYRSKDPFLGEDSLCPEDVEEPCPREDTSLREEVWDGRGGLGGVREDGEMPWSGMWQPSAVPRAATHAAPRPTWRGPNPEHLLKVVEANFERFFKGEVPLHEQHLCEEPLHEGHVCEEIRAGHLGTSPATEETISPVREATVSPVMEEYLSPLVSPPELSPSMDRSVGVPAPPRVPTLSHLSTGGASSGDQGGGTASASDAEGEGGVLFTGPLFIGTVFTVADHKRRFLKVSNGGRGPPGLARLPLLPRWLDRTLDQLILKLLPAVRDSGPLAPPICSVFFRPENAVRYLHEIKGRADETDELQQARIGVVTLSQAYGASLANPASFRFVPEPAQLQAARRILRSQKGKQAAEAFEGVPVFTSPHIRFQMGKGPGGHSVVPYFFNKEQLDRLSRQATEETFRYLLDKRRTSRHLAGSTPLDEAAGADLDEDDELGDPPEVREALGELGEGGVPMLGLLFQSLIHMAADGLDAALLGNRWGRTLIGMQPDDWPVVVESFEQRVAAAEAELYRRLASSSSDRTVSAPAASKSGTRGEGQAGSISSHSSAGSSPDSPALPRAALAGGEGPKGIGTRDEGRTAVGQSGKDELKTGVSREGEGAGVARDAGTGGTPQLDGSKGRPGVYGDEAGLSGGSSFGAMDVTERHLGDVARGKGDHWHEGRVRRGEGVSDEDSEHGRHSGKTGRCRGGIGLETGAVEDGGGGVSGGVSDLRPAGSGVRSEVFRGAGNLESGQTGSDRDEEPARATCNEGRGETMEKDDGKGSVGGEDGERSSAQSGDGEQQVAQNVSRMGAMQGKQEGAGLGLDGGLNEAKAALASFFGALGGRPDMSAGGDEKKGTWASRTLNKRRRLSLLHRNRWWPTRLGRETRQKGTGNPAHGFRGPSDSHAGIGRLLEGFSKGGGGRRGGFSGTLVFELDKFSTSLSPQTGTGPVRVEPKTMAGPPPRSSAAGASPVAEGENAPPVFIAPLYLGVGPHLPAVKRPDAKRN